MGIKKIMMIAVFLSGWLTATVFKKQVKPMLDYNLYAPNKYIYHDRIEYTRGTPSIHGNRFFME